MYFSKHNIFSKIRDSQNYFIINPLSRNADILTPEKAHEIESGKYTNIEEYREKGYLIDEQEEKRLYRQRYLDFLDARESSEVQIFFVPTYSCNFSCSYCYQDQYSWQDQPPLNEVIPAFFSYLDIEFAGKKKYLTIFGGEPLLPGEKAKLAVEQLIAGAAARGLDLAVVTNGYHLSDYIDLLKKASIREIQVTLDGTEQVHNYRRPLKNGQGSFSRIVEGINLALNEGLAINLRVVVDKDNITDLANLADFADKLGWSSNPLFKTQLGRNYELHTCQVNKTRLYDRVSLYEEIYRLIQEKPQLLMFHRPAYSIAHFLFDSGELPDPLFDSCPGAKTEWAFDYTGRIYSCTATVGKDGESLGTFYPRVIKDDKAIELWEERDVTVIPECRDCSLQLACGGGCAAVAKNKSGKLHSPDCRPVNELLEMGISLYFEKGVH